MAQQAHKADNKTNDKPITSNISSEFKIEKQIMKYRDCGILIHFLYIKKST